MFLTAAIILIALAAIVLALRGVFGQFPDNWEWVAVVLAGLGITMATPTIFQMFLGRPKLRTRFDREAQGDNRYLGVFLNNPPVRNKIAIRIGVRREAIQSLTVGFRIAEAGSGTIVIPTYQARIFSDDDQADMGHDRIMLPPTFSVAASVMVAMWDKEGKRVVVPPNRIRGATVLNPGYYAITFSFIIAGTPTMVARRFIVGEGPDDLLWSPS